MVETTPIVERVPIARDQDGVIRISETRVPLETVIDAFRDGATPEEIALAYTSLSLADVYQVIAYYQRNRETVEEYLSQVRVAEDDARKTIEVRWTQVRIRERLLARQP